MVDVNNINNNDNDDDDDAGNNNRGNIVGVNRYSKLVLRYLVATVRFLKWKLDNEREKLKLKIEEKNSTIRYLNWRLPKVENDLQDARRSLRDEKQSNEEKDGRIALVTEQKKQHIQNIGKLRREAKNLIIEANQLESGLKEQKSSKEEAETCVRTLEGEMKTLTGFRL
jgi:chromosome segregation ATPase